MGLSAVISCADRVGANPPRRTASFSPSRFVVLVSSSSASALRRRRVRVPKETHARVAEFRLIPPPIG